MPEGWEEVLVVYVSCFKCLCCSIVRAKGTSNICYKLSANNLMYFLNFNITALSFQELLTLHGAQSLPTDIFSMVQSIFKVTGTHNLNPLKL